MNLSLFNVRLRLVLDTIWTILFWKFKLAPKLFASVICLFMVIIIVCLYNVFAPQKTRRKEQGRLFDRIADSFVALFTSVNPEVKDKIFSVSPWSLIYAFYNDIHVYMLFLASC